VNNTSAQTTPTPSERFFSRITQCSNWLSNQAHVLYFGLSNIKSFHDIKKEAEPSIISRLHYPQKGNLSDYRIQKIAYQNNIYERETLPNDVFFNKSEEDLFFGKDFSELEDAHSYIKSLFTKGRSRKTEDNVDIEKHTASLLDYDSSFQQTTKSFSQGLFYALRHDNRSQGNFGVVFAIDTRGLDALDVNQFYLKVLNVPHKFFTNKEVVILKNIIPSRYKGAAIFGKNYELIQVIENGNSL
jgi:hypothetical protein